MGYAPVPASSVTICRYAAFLARTIKYNSVKQYLNIIRLLHNEWGLINPLKDNFQLSCIMKGIRRHLGDSVVRKKPITPDMLKNILVHLDMTSSLDTTVWAVCLTMFYGLLRRSNVLLNSASQFDTTKHLRRRDILFFPWGLMLHIRWSKVIQFQSRTFDIPFPRLKNNALCPVQAIFKYQQQTLGADINSPAFMYRVNNKQTVLTSDTFIGRVRHCLSLCNVTPTDIATHSFRRGGASFCYSVGLSPDCIKLLGDWRSTCYQSYIENDVNSRFKIVKHMQKHV